MSEKPVLRTEEDWAYAVIDAYVEAFNRVSSAKPEERKLLLKKLEYECLKKLPDLFEALMILTKPEHRPIIYEFFKSFIGALKVWNKYRMKMLS